MQRRTERSSGSAPCDRIAHVGSGRRGGGEEVGVARKTGMRRRSDVEGMMSRSRIRGMWRRMAGVPAAWCRASSEARRTRPARAEARRVRQPRKQERTPGERGSEEAKQARPREGGEG
eukprot:3243528-Rhodomonas_salina.3